MRPETNQTVEAEQYWCGASDRIFGPLALSFNSEVGARLLKCDLHFPSHCKDRDDFGWILIKVGAKERPWFPFSLGVAYQDPSDCCWWSAGSIPQSGLGDNLDRCFFRAMPIRWRSSCPAFISGVQVAFGIGERLPCCSGPTSFFVSGGGSKRLVSSFNRLIRVACRLMLLASVWVPEPLSPTKINLRSGSQRVIWSMPCLA